MQIHPNKGDFADSFTAVIGHGILGIGGIILQIIRNSDPAGLKTPMIPSQANCAPKLE